MGLLQKSFFRACLGRDTSFAELLNMFLKVWIGGFGLEDVIEFVLDVRAFN